MKLTDPKTVVGKVYTPEENVLAGFSKYTSRLYPSNIKDSISPLSIDDGF